MPYLKGSETDEKGVRQPLIYKRVVLPQPSMEMVQNKNNRGAVIMAVGTDEFLSEQLRMSDESNYRLTCLLENYIDFINKEGLSDQFNEFLKRQRQYKPN